MIEDDVRKIKKVYNGRFKKPKNSRKIRFQSKILKKKETKIKKKTEEEKKMK
jgi:hypothetical protein